MVTNPPSDFKWCEFPACLSFNYQLHSVFTTMFPSFYLNIMPYAYAQLFLFIFVLCLSLFMWSCFCLWKSTKKNSQPPAFQRNMSCAYFFWGPQKRRRRFAGQIFGPPVAITEVTHLRLTTQSLRRRKAQKKLCAAQRASLAQYEDGGMWFEVDRKLNCTFDIDNLK